MLTDFGGKVGHVPCITASITTLVERLSGRWTCQAQGHIFHQIYSPPKKTGVCDMDGSELYQREDDKVETVKRRIQVYIEQTAPLIAYYRQRGLLARIDGERQVEEVTADLLAVLKHK
jgi:adenylate kinase